jgi:hypothetical protein
MGAKAGRDMVARRAGKPSLGDPKDLDGKIINEGAGDFRASLLRQIVVHFGEIVERARRDD